MSPNLHLCICVSYWAKEPMLLAARRMVLFAKVIVARPLHPVLPIEWKWKKMKMKGKVKTYPKSELKCLNSESKRKSLSSKWNLSLEVKSYPESEEKTVWKLKLASVVLVERSLVTCQSVNDHHYQPWSCQPTFLMALQNLNIQDWLSLLPMLKTGSSLKFIVSKSFLWSMLVSALLCFFLHLILI